MAWRMAAALEVLRKQLNEAFPKRSKVSDGGIGDEKHASRSSDHNPWVGGLDGKGIVTARDFTHDPKTGINCQWLADSLVAARDPRIKYIIWNKQICSGIGQNHEPWEWRPYKGVNSHSHHLHVSVRPIPGLYDSEDLWELDFPPVDKGPDDVAKVIDLSAAGVPAPGDPRPFSVEIADNRETPELPSQQDATAAESEQGERPEKKEPEPAPQVHADNVENLNMPEPKPPAPLPQNEFVVVRKERSSIWAKIGAAFAIITGLGINLGNVINNRLNEMTLPQLGYTTAGVAIIAAGLWLYDRSAQRAHEKTQKKVDIASDTLKNAVELKG